MAFETIEKIKAAEVSAAKRIAEAERKAKLTIKEAQLKAQNIIIEAEKEAAVLIEIKSEKAEKISDEIIVTNKNSSKLLIQKLKAEAEAQRETAKNEIIKIIIR